MAEKICILVVDDDTGGLYAKCRMLQRAGFEVEQAVTGGDALRLIRTKRAQLVILDVQLPDMNGLEIAETIKADSELSSIPVLQTSAAFTNAEDAAAGLNRGADAYLTEPLKEDVLIATVNALLRARRAEEELRKQREWLQVTLKSIGDGVIATDMAGRVIFMNSIAESLTGCRESDVKGQLISETLKLVDETTRAEVALPFDDILKGERPTHLSGSTILVGKNGTEYPVEDNVAPIKDIAGGTTGMVVVLREIGERKRAEKRMLQLFASEQNARREAEAANRAKDEFLGVVSHELRTPLTSMLGWGEAAEKRTLTKEKSLHAIAVIERNVKSQTQIIEDLLDISRIIAGKLVLNREQVDLEEVIRHSIDSIKAAALSGEIEIRTTLVPVRFMGDEHRLQQVLWNLLTNAIKFTPKGGWIDIRLSVEKELVTLSVQDSGVGIDLDFLPKVFDRFSQENVTPSRKTGGLGIGLSIVLNLVKMHGGEVHAASGGPGMGATFTITLPATNQKDFPKPLANSTLIYREENRLDGLSVLILEDESSTREMLVMLLSSAGAETVAVGTAAEAMSALQSRRPNVIVSDIGLPGEDGFSFIRRLRIFEKSMGGSIPALALTAYAKPENKWQALEAGFQVHLGKPVEPTVLIKMVAKLGGMSRSDDALNKQQPSE